ncbi:MAG: FHA domain-containing protein [Ruminococcaceae bacterium]|nr:FHA domain-containing protein [Oscillospiraceae bacterium]
MEYINSAYESLSRLGVLGYVLLIMRIITPVITLFVVWRSFTSYKKGVRRAEPKIMLRDIRSDKTYPILYWENSIGRSKSCDIILEDPAVSRDHAVLMRRKEGWFICDTGSKWGVGVGKKKITENKLVNVGDVITLGNTQLVLEDTEFRPFPQKKGFSGFLKNAASAFSLMVLSTIVHFSMFLQLEMGIGDLKMDHVLSFLTFTAAGWILYVISMLLIKRVNFEIETIGFLLSGISVMLLMGESSSSLKTQVMSAVIGMLLFLFLVWFMGDLKRVSSWRLLFGIGAIGLFILNMAIGTTLNGAKNWIFIGSLSIQPSELIKIAFIFVGASTLDRLQTKKNITVFLGFASICLGFLFIMRDFGTALIFFAAILIIAFMRSGSIRTVVLLVAVALFGVVLILYFRPYVADRFSGWMHIWEHINDSLGYQQTRALTYIASGGLFGMGLGRGYLHYIAAGDSDLVFAMLCEEQGMLMGYVVVFAIMMFILYVRTDVTKSRSTFYSIASCAAAGLLLFQACLNVFGTTDILPLTGVTLPFISAGGSSVVSCWGLLSFIKASDERTYAVKKSKADAKNSKAKSSHREEDDGEGLSREELMEISRNVQKAKQKKSSEIDKEEYQRRYKQAESKEKAKRSVNK